MIPVFILAAASALLGLSAGLVLAKSAEEELAAGKKFFYAMQVIVITLMAASAVYNHKINIIPYFGALETSLLFLLGFPTGSLLYMKKYLKRAGKANKKQTK